MDRGAWWTIVPRVAKNQTQLSTMALKLAMLPETRR